LYFFRRTKLSNIHYHPFQQYFLYKRHNNIVVEEYIKDILEKILIRRGLLKIVKMQFANIFGTDLRQEQARLLYAKMVIFLVRLCQLKL